MSLPPRIGISGWNYRSWRGDFYPKGLVQRRELEYAASRFNSIEINGSFYSLKRPSTYREWYEAAPPGFLFAVKGSRFVTHMKKLNDVRVPLANFLASGILRLCDKLGPILWQFPPMLGFMEERFTGFLELLPRTHAEAAAPALDHDARLDGRDWTTAEHEGTILHTFEIRHPSLSGRCSFISITISGCMLRMMRSGWGSGFCERGFLPQRHQGHKGAQRREMKIVWGLMALLVSCSPGADDRKAALPSDRGNGAAPAATEADFMDAPITPADGFDFPFGDGDGGGSYVDMATGKKHDGWYIATNFCEQYSLGIHPGEDWNGRGGGNTDYGQPVAAVAAGRVVSARNHGRLWGNVVVIEHLFYENHTRRIVRSVYAHLSRIDVKVGQEVKRRATIGAIGRDPDNLFAAHLHLEIRTDTSLDATYWPTSHRKDVAWVREYYLQPSAFIRAHRTLPVPQKEKVVVVVDQESYRMRLYEKGKLAGEYAISLGQQKGQKRVQGDNRTPKGMYYVIAHERGNFPGSYGGYYGGHWIKLNYPNRYDAAYGRAQGFFDATREQEIAKRWEQRKPTIETTRLGGGIGIHGWIKEWEDDGPRHLSWGCVVMHIRDIKKVYDRIPIGAMVVIV